MSPINSVKSLNETQSSENHPLASSFFDRDVPDIRLARYPPIFCYPVIVPVPAKIFTGAGYCNHIIYLFNGQEALFFANVNKNKQM